MGFLSDVQPELPYGVTSKPLGIPQEINAEDLLIYPLGDQPEPRGVQD